MPIEAPPDALANEIAQRLAVFEVAWEVANKVGGIHTVLSSRALAMVERYGDNYITVGPLLPGLADDRLAFDDDAALRPFVQRCQSVGIQVRVGRWRVTGSPRCILVGASHLIPRTDDILSRLWLRDAVDSLGAGWDYIEPTLFGVAAAEVIELWHDQFLAPHPLRTVAFFHEWLVGSGLLEIAQRRPTIGRIFVTHATVLGRSLANEGRIVDSVATLPDPTTEARRLGVRSKHSMEGAAAKKADIFTTVSEMTADEAAVVHRRRPDLVTPNGLSPETIAALVGKITRRQARQRLDRLLSDFLGRPVDRCAIALTSGRYEYVNKGFDVFLEALAQLATQPGEPIVAVFAVPAGQSGWRRALMDATAGPRASHTPHSGPSTHQLFDEENDPIARRCRQLGLHNAPGARVCVVHIPVYLDGHDGLLDLPYEALLQAADVSCFPSFYEPWGYTPHESVALGVPTITTDLSGFGRHVMAADSDDSLAVSVVRRRGRARAEVVHDVAAALDRFVAHRHARPRVEAACADVAERVTWGRLLGQYAQASMLAADIAHRRSAAAPMVSGAWQVVPPAPDDGEDTTPHRPTLTEIEVRPRIPERIAALARIADNLWWCWNPAAQRLFEDADPDAWHESRSNPRKFLQIASAERLRDAAADTAWTARLDAVAAEFDRYLARHPDSITAGVPDDDAPTGPVAYFSMEFGIHESLKIYSGGLGVLAGDHVKAASDLGVPLVGVGLFYSQGYLDQRIRPDGQQVALPQHNERGELPLTPVLGPDGHRLVLSVQLPAGLVSATAWRVDVGRSILYLLDADIDANPPEFRALSARLYGGDHELRLRQEILLGACGVRLLEAVGVEPAVFHLNEGHSAFLSLERVARLRERFGLDFHTAATIVRNTTVYTTHTPVPAGHDHYTESLVRRNSPDYAERLGLAWADYMALAQVPSDRGTFHMSFLAARFASRVNGVSKLHAAVSREIFAPAWPALLEEETPILHVTNGVHPASWTGAHTRALLGAPERALRWDDFDPDAIRDVPARAIWDARLAARDRLRVRLRTLLETYLRRRPYNHDYLRAALERWDDRALVIGFARRTATYKRLTLLFSDPDRLARIVNHPERPVRILIAGKAHPADLAGADMLAQAMRLSRQPDLLGKIVVIEGYDIFLARTLLHGVDVWMNTPRPPLEASGTSGMKAAMNGALNFSTADGWFCEGYDGTNAWQIGRGRVFDDAESQDAWDAADIYHLLESSIVPEFFDRDAEGIPERWIDRVRRSLATLGRAFSAERMVRDYVSLAYGPLSRADSALRAEEFREARSAAERQQKRLAAFPTVRIERVQNERPALLQAGDSFRVRVVVRPGPLSIDDLAAEVVLAPAERAVDAPPPEVVPLDLVGPIGDGTYQFEKLVPVTRTGRVRTGARVRLRVASPFDDLLLGAVTWA